MTRPGLHATISVSRNRRTQHPPTSADDVRTITTAAPAHCNIHTLLQTDARLPLWLQSIIQRVLPIYRLVRSRAGPTSLSPQAQGHFYRKLVSLAVLIRPIVQVTEVRR